MNKKGTMRNFLKSLYYFKNKTDARLSKVVYKLADAPLASNRGSTMRIYSLKPIQGIPEKHNSIVPDITEISSFKVKKKHYYFIKQTNNCDKKIILAKI